MINSQYYMLDHPFCSQHYISLIQMSKRWKKYPIIIFIFSMLNDRLKLNKLQGSTTFLVSETKKENIADILC